MHQPLSRFAAPVFSLVLAFAIGTTALADFLVADGLNDQILRFKDNGTPLGPFVLPASGGLNNPVCMVWGPDRNLYVGGSPIAGRESQLLVFDGTTGAFLRAVPTVNARDAWYMLAFAPNGDLIAGDDSSIRRINRQTGAVLAQAGQGAVFTPGKSVIGPDGRVLFGMGSGPGNAVHRLYAFDPATNALSIFCEDSRINGAFGLDYGPDGLLYFGNVYGDEDIYRLDPATGAGLELFAVNSALSAPGDLIFVPGGGMWMSGVLGDGLARFDAATGEHLYTIPGPAYSWDMLYVPEPTSLSLPLVALAAVACPRSRQRVRRRQR